MACAVRECGPPLLLTGVMVPSSLSETDSFLSPCLTWLAAAAAAAAAAGDWTAGSPLRPSLLLFLTSGLESFTTGFGLLITTQAAPEGTRCSHQQSAANTSGLRWEGKGKEEQAAQEQSSERRAAAGD